MSLDPIEHRYSLRCSPDHAFQVYVNQIGRWWHPSYTANADTFESVTIDPGVDGRIVEHHRDGTSHEWGRVRTWEPGRRLVYSSSLAQDPSRASEVTVVFSPRPAGSNVLFSHGGWDADNADDREKFTEWRSILDRFAARAEGRES